MTSKYLRCDGCGDVIDRRPPPDMHNGGTYHWSMSKQLKADAREQGWIVDAGRDLCPKCLPPLTKEKLEKP